MLMTINSKDFSRHPSISCYLMPFWLATYMQTYCICFNLRHHSIGCRFSSLPFVRWLTHSISRSGKRKRAYIHLFYFSISSQPQKKTSVFLFSIAIGETNGNKIQYVLFFLLLVSKLQTIPMRLQSAKGWPTRNFLRQQFDLISLYLQRLEKLAGKMCGDDVIDFRRYVKKKKFDLFSDMQSRKRKALS